MAASASYPADRAGRQQLADELAAMGLMPTQGKQHFDRDQIDRMAEAMTDGTFDWTRAGLQPVIPGPNGDVLGGHHRMIAAHLAGIDLAAVPGGATAGTGLSEKLPAGPRLDRRPARGIMSRAAGIDPSRRSPD